MAQLDNVKTLESEQVWSSPDGQRKIYKLVLEFEGKKFNAKTYSGAIAQIGWAGNVESYEKPTKNGSEAFVKQPPKEGGYPQSSTTQPSGGRSYQPKDEKGIQAQMAIKAAVQALGPKPEKVEIATYTGIVHDVAVELFAMIDVVKNSQEPAVEKSPTFGDGTPLPTDEEIANADNLDSVELPL